MDQMYEIVAGIEFYPQFVPWCTRGDIISRKPGMCKAKMEIGFPPLVERYTCMVTLAKPHLVKVSLGEKSVLELPLKCMHAKYDRTPKFKIDRRICELR